MRFPKSIADAKATLASLPDQGLALYRERYEVAARRALDEAIALLHGGAGEAKILAGGQSLVPTLNMRLSAPALLVDVNRVAALRGV